MSAPAAALRLGAHVSIAGGLERALERGALAAGQGNSVGYRFEHLRDILVNLGILRALGGRTRVGARARNLVAQPLGGAAKSL